MGWGDEMIAAAEAERLHKKTGRPVHILDAKGRPRWHEAWIGNPAIAGPKVRTPTAKLVNCGWHRPYTKGYDHAKAQWQWNYDFHVTPAKLYLTPAEKQFGEFHKDLIVIEPNVKAQAPLNKQWGRDKWQWLVDNAPVQFTQLGPEGTELLRGVGFVKTPAMRLAAAVVAHMRAAVLPEGGLHHIAAAFNRPAVVLFGGYIHPSLTGYSMHVNMFTGGVACGMREDCAHCRAAMDAITPEEVLSNLMGVLK